MSYSTNLHQNPSLDGSVHHSGPSGIRIQRRINATEQPFGPPPTVPVEAEVREQEKDPVAQTSSGVTSTLTKTNTTRRGKERVKEKERENEADKENKDKERPTHTPLGERTSYVEEPSSTTTTLERCDRKLEKERALVRRITNEMQIAQYVHKMEIAQTSSAKPTGAFSPGVYRIRSLRFFENGLRRSLWYLGKSIANHELFFTVLPIFLLSLSLIGPIMHKDKLSISLPFSLLTGGASDIISNGYGIHWAQKNFNYSNPAFSTLNHMDQNSFSILLKTISNKDTILRKDAVLAYTSLKKKLDGYPVGNKEFLESCPVECETDKEMVDKIIKKSPQVTLTYPETFVSMSKDASNLSRVYLGTAIGGVDTDTDGAISRAQALLMSFQLRDDLSQEQNNAWQNNFIDQIHITSAANVTLSFWSPSSFTSWVVRCLTKAHRWLVVSAAILALFCFIAAFGTNAYQSKPLVGIQIALSLLVSCLGGLFVQFAGAAHFNPLVWPIFFIIVGIGILWLFFLHLSWSRYSFAAVHPTEKLAFLLAHDGPGIVAAATVIIVTFMLIGAIAPIPHMEASFVVIAVAVAILLFLGLIYLAVFIYIDGRREAKGVKWFQLFKTGDTHFTAPNLTDFDSASLFSLHDRLLDSRPSLTRAIGSLLITSNMRYPVAFFCTAYLIFAVWGCANVRVDIKEEFFLPSASPSREFLEQYREMFGKTIQYLEVRIDQAVEYHEDAVRNSIFDLMDNVVNEGYAVRSVSWLAEFVKFEKNTIYDINPDTFVPVVNLVFLATDPYKRFISDITFDRHQTQISRSRMYLELTQKGVDERVTLVQSILAKAREVHLPVSVRAPFTMSLQHDIKVLSSNLFIFGVLLVCMFVLSLILLGQPGLTFLLLFTLIAVTVETVGYANHWGVPLNVITFTMILAGNALTSVVVIAFCYSYSMSGKSQVRAGMRIQYTFQATLLPVLFSCLVPVITYLALFAVDAPLIVHIWKVLLLNSAANLIHYLFFLPNMILLFSEYFSMGCTSFNCAECCCDMEDESSIYYIPTTGRAVHPEGIYHHASYTYSIPKSIVTAPPNYLAIAGPPSIGTTFVPEYNQSESHRGRQTRRSHRRNESSTAQFEITTPRVDRDGRRSRRRLSRDDSIYEAPPSPRLSSRSASPQRVRVSRDARAAPYFEEAINMHQKHWRPYVQPQPFMFYSGPTFPQRR